MIHLKLTILSKFSARRIQNFNIFLFFNSAISIQVKIRRDQDSNGLIKSAAYRKT